MSPPINIDGSSVSSVTIDGTSVSEVTVDGEAVFSVIPDSVIVQNTATTWSQGDNTWVDDATSDGAQDVTITGDVQATTLSDGSEALAFDGADDHGALPMPPELDTPNLNEFAVEMALQYTGSGEFDRFWGTINSGGSEGLRMSDENGNSGSFEVQLSDKDGNSFQFRPSSNPGLDDGTRHDVTIIVNDAVNGNAEIIIDGSSVSVTVGSNGSPNNFDGFEHDMGIAARNAVDNTYDLNLDIDYGAFRWHDQAITGQTIGAYPF